MKEPKISDQDFAETPEKQSGSYKDLDEVNKRKKDKELPENFDYEAYNNFRLDKQELEIIESSMALLDDVIQNAATIEDLKSKFL